jgi:hypothetical protein
LILAVLCFAIAGATLWYLVASAHGATDVEDMPCNALERVGFAFDAHDEFNQAYPGDSLSRYDLTALFGERNASGWYYDFGYRVDGAYEVGTLDYAIQMLWSVPNTVTLEAIILGSRASPNDNNPSDAFIVGNEPDIRGQGDDTPTEYAQFYHDAYTRIKAIDANRQVGTAGVATPTLLRMAYWNRVFSEYQRLYGVTMPVDIWTVHGYLFDERRHIPPGMDDSKQLANAEAANLLDRIVVFRQWMADHGYRDAELWITEMSDMAAIPALLAAQSEYGLASDDSRDVQRLAWFSLNYWLIPDSALYDKENTQPTEMAFAFRDVVDRIGGACVASPVPTAPAIEMYYFPVVEKGR